MTAVLEGRLDDGGLTAAERALMEYVRLITEESHKSTAEDVQNLRDVGWAENQIAEAVYITAMFAFFNRVADSFGIPPQNYLIMGKLTP
jgi:alkylhydroperoxidase family enzyme